MNKKILVSGMTCHHCEMRVQKALENEGFTDIKADKNTAMVKLTDENNVSDERIIAIIEEAGYEVKEIIKDA
ncbi:MAG: heavy-metal-associated domain-containing protein [Clostridiales bacterium]|nr:heavy-metal-associated domain-containing protein [Clostridiales bacterium]